MQSPFIKHAAVWILIGAAALSRALPGKEFLTPKEIEQIQDTQAIDGRIKIYLDAAALRLKTSEDRLNGKESEQGDPLEFFSVDEMLDGYYQILKSVMMNLDGAVQRREVDRGRLGKALKSLKDSTARSAKDLSILKKMAEDKKLESTWNLVNQAIEITDGARQGAEAGLGRFPAEPEKRKGKGKS
jgi:hypothetical protein